MTDTLARKYDEPTELSPRRPAVQALRALLGNKAAVFGLVIIVGLGALALLAPYITSYNPNQQTLTAALQPPSSQHWFGTDNLGRDIFTRILYGGRISLMVGVLAVSLAVVIGVPLGLLSGFVGGWVDMTIQRIAGIGKGVESRLRRIAHIAEEIEHQKKKQSPQQRARRPT